MNETVGRRDTRQRHQKYGNQTSNNSSSFRVTEVRPLRNVEDHFNCYAAMEETQLESRHFAAAKACTIVSGIWPFEDGRMKRVKIIMWYILFCSALTFQIARIVVFYSFDIMVEEIPYVCVALSSTVKHFNFAVNGPKLAKLLKNLSKDWSSKTMDDEMTITQTYAKRAFLYALLYKVIIWAMCGVFSCMPLLPHIMDAIQPLNESRPRMFMYQGYYFVDPDTYYYYIIGYTFISLLAVGSIMVGTDMIMIYLVQYACGLLIAAGHRFKHGVDAVSVSSKGCALSSDTQYRKLCISIQSHKKAIQTVYDIESLNAASMFVQVGLVMVAFSITLVLVAVREFTADMFLFYMFCLVQIIHILFLNIQGQFVINSHDAIYDMIYEARWYEDSPRIQALYVLVLRRCLTPPVLTAGGLFPMNLNTFAEIVKTSVSYFTVLKSC